MCEASQIQDTTKQDNALPRIGLQLTFLYVFGLIAGSSLAFWLGGLKVQPVSLNELGDLLAGLFGPLAILWIILGFFQQGRELRNSVETLKMQARELALSVDQQKELVLVTRETLEHERQALDLQMRQKDEARKARILPELYLHEHTLDDPPSCIYGLRIRNAGASAYNGSVFFLGDLKKKIGPINCIPGGELFERQRLMSDGIPYIEDAIETSIEYTDLDGNRQKELVLLHPQPWESRYEPLSVSKAS